MDLSDILNMYVVIPLSLISSWKIKSRLFLQLLDPQELCNLAPSHPTKPEKPCVPPPLDTSESLLYLFEDEKTKDK